MSIETQRMAALPSVTVGVVEEKPIDTVSNGRIKINIM